MTGQGPEQPALALSSRLEWGPPAVPFNQNLSYGAAVWGSSLNHSMPKFLPLINEENAAFQIYHGSVNHSPLPAMQLSSFLGWERENAGKYNPEFCYHGAKVLLTAISFLANNK